MIPSSMIDLVVNLKYLNDLIKIGKVMNKLLEKHGVSKEQYMNMLKNHYAGIDS